MVSRFSTILKPMKSVTTFVTLVPLLLISGCSLFGGDKAQAPMELLDISERIAVDKLWAIDTGSPKGDERIGDLSLTLITDAELNSLIGSEASGSSSEDASIAGLVSADRKGRLMIWQFPQAEEGGSSAVNYEKGPARLVFKETRQALLAGPSVAAGRLLILTESAELVALAGPDLSERWRASLSSESTAKPGSNESLVAVRTVDGALDVFKLEDGSSAWDYRHELPALTLRSIASPLLTDTQIFAGFETGHLRAMNLSDGSVVWQARVAQPKGRTDLERVVDVDTPAIIDGGSVYTAAYQGNIVAIDRAQGRLQWRFPFSTAKAIDVVDGQLAAVGASGEVVLLDAYTGSLLWRNEDLLRRGLGSPKLLDEHVAVVDAKGFLHLLDLASGEIVGRRGITSASVNARVLRLEDGVLLVDTGRASVLGLRLRAIKAAELPADDENASENQGDEIELDFGMGTSQLDALGMPILDADPNTDSESETEVDSESDEPEPTEE